MNIKSIQGPYKTVFMSQDEIEAALILMEQDPGLKTGPGLDDDTPSFFARHATYLKNHPKVNPEYYLANLRTMIKIRPAK